MPCSRHRVQNAAHYFYSIVQRSHRIGRISQSGIVEPLNYLNEQHGPHVVDEGLLDREFCGSCKGYRIGEGNERSKRSDIRVETPKIDLKTIPKNPSGLG